jgi:hypothetical protein
MFALMIAANRKTVPCARSDFDRDFARVEQTLLSAALDVDFVFDPSGKVGHTTKARTAVEERRFSAA